MKKLFTAIQKNDLQTIKLLLEKDFEEAEHIQRYAKFKWEKYGNDGRV